MLRRSFRIGLTLGLLGGLAFALVKVFGAAPTRDGRSGACAHRAVAAARPRPAARRRRARWSTRQSSSRRRRGRRRREGGGDEEGAAPKAAAAGKAWVEPTGDGVPDQPPGEGQAVVEDLPPARDAQLRPHEARTAATPTPRQAEADGLRAAKR